MTVTSTITPEQFIALKRAEFEAYARELDGRFNEGYFLSAARLILGDKYVEPYGEVAILVDWHSHGAKLIQVNGKPAWSVIDHSQGYCERCGGILYS